MRPDPRSRPDDPAGTRPKVDPESLLPAPREPAIDGEAVEEDEAAPPATSGELVAARSGALDAPAPHETQHSPRFQFLWGALAALGAIAVAAAVIVATGGSSGPAVDTWSTWHPRGPDAVASIAQHVGHEYRLSDGNQLVAVTGGPMEVAGLPMQIALRESPAAGGNIQLLGGTGVLFRLCGLGSKCSIQEGKPSTQRHLLLRRESLELALYTFRYVDGIDEVVVFLPPRPGQDPSEALLFRRGDIDAELHRPLQATLTRRTPSVAGVDASPDAPLVNRITTQALYRFGLTQANQDASVFLVLQPFAQTPATGGSAPS